MYRTEMLMELVKKHHEWLVNKYGYYNLWADVCIDIATDRAVVSVNKTGFVTDVEDLIDQIREVDDICWFINEQLDGENIG